MNPFDEDYFLRGPETGKSNFRDYRWLPDQTISTVTHLKRLLNLEDGVDLLDYGCATGNYVRAMRRIGLDAWGVDISEWAIAHADPEVKPFVSNHPNGSRYDLVFSKDCFEHIELGILHPLVQNLLSKTKRMFVIVPLAEKKEGAYVHPKEEKDSTHVNRWTLPDWLVFFESCSTSFVVNGSFRYPGLKPGLFEVECGYGFFLLNRI